jgi:hypothetical protein
VKDHALIEDGQVALADVFGDSHAVTVPEMGALNRRDPEGPRGGSRSRDYYLLIKIDPSSSQQ